MIVAIALIIGVVVAFFAVKLHQSNKRQGISWFRASSFRSDRDGKPITLNYWIRAGLPIQLGMVVLICIVFVLASIAKNLVGIWE